MSSSAHLTWDEGEGISGEDWSDFCKEHGIEHSPATSGGNVFYAGRVEISFGESNYDAIEPPDYAERVHLSTYHFGDAMPGVARLTRALWQAHGGSLSCDPEIRRLITRDHEVDVLKALHAALTPSPTPALDMKVLATIEFPGVVYLAHEDSTGLPSDVDVWAPWIKGQVPGGQLIVCGVPLGKVSQVRPDSEAMYEIGNETNPEWVIHTTDVDLVLDLGALISHA